MAGNCLIFGIRVLQAANVPVNDRAVRGIAIAAATGACLIHSFSRRGGIWLGNLFAFIKVLMLLLIIITGICSTRETMPVTIWHLIMPSQIHQTIHMATRKHFLQSYLLGAGLINRTM